MFKRLRTKTIYAKGLMWCHVGTKRFLVPKHDNNEKVNNDN